MKIFFLVTQYEGTFPHIKLWHVRADSMEEAIKIEKDAIDKNTYSLIKALEKNDNSITEVHRIRKKFGIPKEGYTLKEWDKAKKILKEAFERAEITSCELQLEGCNNYFLTYCHGDKRRYLEGNELLSLVVIGCINCHRQIERMPRLRMRSIVERIIENRHNPVLLEDAHERAGF